jgi:hypothetical protein
MCTADLIEDAVECGYGYDGECCLGDPNMDPQYNPDVFAGEFCLADVGGESAAITLADFLCHRACRSPYDLCSDCESRCTDTTDMYEMEACQQACRASNGGPCGAPSLSGAMGFTDCGAVDYTEDLWGSSALCVDKSKCSELCGMIPDCQGIVASDMSARCYLMTGDCSPRPVKYFHGAEYLPKKGERLSCPSEAFRQLEDGGPLLRGGEKGDPAPKTFGEDVADDGFDVAAALREGMFAAVDEVDFD